MEIAELGSYDVTGLVEFPVYRAAFWAAPKRPPELGDAASPTAFNAERYRVTGARDVYEVLEWASNDGRRFELFVELPSASEHGVEVMRLSGFNPSAVGYSHPADYLSDPSAIESTVAWIGAQGYDHL